MNDVLEYLDELIDAAPEAPQETEVHRIVELPVRHQWTDDELEGASLRWVQADHWARGFRLFAPQAAGILEYETYGKLFGLIPVGWGKTLLTLMVAEAAFRRQEVKRSLLLVPANAWDQLCDIDLRWARSRIGMKAPVHLLGRRSIAQRTEIARRRWPGLYIMTASLMEKPDAEQILSLVRPQLVIVDEAHHFKHPRTPRSARLLRYIRKHKPKFVALSGTMTTRGLRDYWHLITLALREGSPVPLSIRIALAWADILDAGAPMHPTDADALADLVDWASAHTKKKLPEDLIGFRRAYEVRFNAAPGVVSFGGAQIHTVLVMENEPIANYTDCDGWDELFALAKAVRKDFIAPNGDKIDHAINAYAWLYQLASGFFYDTYWPDAADVAESKGWDARKAEALLELAKKHLGLQNFYHEKLREFLKRPIPGYDTPFLVASEIKRYGKRLVGKDLFEAWREMHDALDTDMPKRHKRPVRVCSFKVDAVADWAEQIGGQDVVVWFQHQAMGEWAGEIMRARGLRATVYTAGMDREIRDPQSGKGVALASIGAHGQAKNLQHFKHVAFLQWPRPAGRAEQVLGRVHRNGQDLDELVVKTFNTLVFDHMNFAATLVDACYAQQTLGQRQKVITCTHVPVPKIWATEVLQELGLQPQTLNSKAKDFITERFGVQNPSEERRVKP